MKAILRSGFFAIAIILALAVPAIAGPLEDGVAAYQRGDCLAPNRHVNLFMNGGAHRPVD